MKNIKEKINEALVKGKLKQYSNENKYESISKQLFNSRTGSIEYKNNYIYVYSHNSENKFDEANISKSKLIEIIYNIIEDFNLCDFNIFIAYNNSKCIPIIGFECSDNWAPIAWSENLKDWYIFASKLDLPSIKNLEKLKKKSIPYKIGEKNENIQKMLFSKY